MIVSAVKVKSGSKPQPTTLAERIAKLNASNPASASSSSTPATTGARGKISDKIASFQKEADREAPLKVHGSFALGGRPTTLPGSAEKPRVASLGSGRASVPLNVVKTPRSVSSGDARSRTGSDAASDVGSAASIRDGNSTRSSSRAGEPTSPIQTRQTSPPTSTPSSPLPPTMVRTSTFDRVRNEIGISGPGPESVSSTRVETGSLTSEAGPDPSTIQSTASAVNSPLSSPLAEPVTPKDQPPTLELPPTNGGMPKSASLALPAGPLSALRHSEGPSRTDSVASLSSMLVQDGSVSSDDGGELAEKKTPTLDAIPTMVGNMNDGATTPDVSSHQTDKEREAKTKEELKQYEAETEDAPVPPLSFEAGLPKPAFSADPPQSVEFERRPSPVLSTFPPLDATPAPILATHSEPEGIVVAEADPTLPRSSTHPSINQPENGNDEEGKTTDDDGAGYGDFLDEFTNEEELAAAGSSKAVAEPAPEESSMPMVRCSDCHAQISLLDLADHACAPSTLPPALSSPQTSPVPPATETFPSRAIPDVPQDDVPEDILPISPRMTSTGLARSSSGQSANASRLAQKLDAYVPVTASDVPDDESHDDEYGHFADQTDDMPESPADPVARRHVKHDSFPSFDEDEVPATHSPLFTPDVPVSPTKSKYLPRGGIPGLDDSDSEDYEGGSATIVRTVASHR